MTTKMPILSVNPRAKLKSNKNSNLHYQPWHLALNDNHEDDSKKTIPC